MTSWRVIEGDCVEAMRAMDEASVDAVVCDPPYDLTTGKRGGTGAASINLDSPYGRARIGTGNGAGGFMGKAWDGTGVAFDPGTWAEALRVLKPGGHLLAFGGTRTYHRLTCAIEDAGFEIRDCLAWLYGSGFPKSLDVSKAIDKAAGAEREVVGTSSRHSGRAFDKSKGWNGNDLADAAVPLTAPATPDAERWQGWGTALKPAWESIVLARKPLTGTVAATVLAHGTGALNVDGCRIEADARPVMVRTETTVGANSMSGESTGATGNGEMTTLGRWPANVVLDPEAAALLDEQTGEMRDGVAVNRNRGDERPMTVAGAPRRIDSHEDVGYGGSGGASRFFYCPKADAAERGLGLHGQRNSHPTVKPVALMRWLCRLVTPPGGTILDPFTGSGTTGIAALREGFAFIGIEREAEYAAIARARIIGDAPLINGATELAA